MFDDNIEKFKNFLEMEKYHFSLEDENEKIKEMCVAKLCEVLGIEFAYNYKNQMFQIFSSVLAEAICQKLKIKKQIAEDRIRLFKYNGINFVERAKYLLDTEDVDEAILDIFNLVDNNKHLLLN